MKSAAADPGGDVAGFLKAPLMYGYLRLSSNHSDDEIQGLERRLLEFAAVLGFCFAATFYDDHDGSYAGLAEVCQELQRSEARDLVVPSLAHLSSHPLLRAHLLAQIDAEVNAKLWVLDS